jgi:hypothetical protein
VSFGSTLNYNNQHGGLNGWINNGNYDDGDTTRTTWANDGKTYLTQNDGLGPNASLVGGRNMFLMTISDFTTIGAGVSLTLVNSMDDFGTVTQINTNGWSDNSTWKTGGLYSKDGVFYWSVSRQDVGNNRSKNASIMKSTDNGGSWCSPAHTDHATGLCSITPSATGDAPTDGQAMFGATTNIQNIHFIQYGQDGATPIAADGNGTYTNCVADSSNWTHMYACRALNTDLPKSDGSLYQFYKGTDPAHDCSVDASWGTVGSKVATENAGEAGIVSIISTPIYVPLYRSYVMVVGNTVADANQNQLLSAPTFCGPWSSIASISEVIPNGWNVPILKSLSGSSVTYLSTGGPRQRSLDIPATSEYNVLINQATFSGIPVSAPATLFPFTRGAGQMQIKPQAMPTALTTVAAADAFLKGVTITNPTASAITALVEDAQGVPVPFLGTVSIAAHSAQVIPIDYWCPGGFSVQAGAAGLDYYATWTQ